MEFKKLKDDLNKANEHIKEKNKAFDISIVEKEFLRQQLKAVKDSLMNAKQIIQGHLAKEIKKVRDYLV